MASAIVQGSFQPSPRSYQTPLSVRLGCRSGAITGPTAGMAPGHVQGNLAVLPQALADEFPRFVSNVRGRGLLCAFDCPAREERDRLIEKAREKRLLVLPAGR